MTKKKNNVYFNIFNVEDNIEQEENSVIEEPDNNNEQFFSIAKVEDKPIKSDDLSGQITMFTEENAPTDDDEVLKTTEIKEKITLIEEPIEEMETEIISEEETDENIIQEFFIETVVSEKNSEETSKEALKENDEVFEVTTKEIEEASENNKTKQTKEEEMLVSLLETNVLDQEVAEEFIEEYAETKEDNDCNIFKDLPDFKVIKKQKIFDDFETPYVYHGKNGDRIRYRLSMPTDNDAKRNRTKKAVAGWIITVALALLLAIVIRTFVFVVATVDGPSMKPTLISNDRLFVTKFTYTFTDVKRGDVVICRYNTLSYPDMYVKRIIGLPGETISIIDGIVYINGAELKEDYTLPSTPYDRYYNMDAIYIPTGYVFVMGDNRNNSADSRMESIGAISIDNIIGKAQARIFPFTSMCILEEDN